MTSRLMRLVCLLPRFLCLELVMCLFRNQWAMIRCLWGIWFFSQARAIPLFMTGQGILTSAWVRMPVCRMSLWLILVRFLILQRVMIEWVEKPLGSMRMNVWRNLTRPMKGLTKSLLRTLTSASAIVTMLQNPTDSE